MLNEKLVSNKFIDECKTNFLIVKFYQKLRNKEKVRELMLDLYKGEFDENQLTLETLDQRLKKLNDKFKQNNIGNIGDLR